MIQEDKELLLIDLCSRLPYGVIVSCAEGTIMGIHWDKVKLDASLLSELQDNDALSNVKPYLRRMSSMTEEERNQYLSIKMQETERVALAEVYRPTAISEIMDWLNAHHLDYRGLIERGLALEAPDGMYNHNKI
jgi:hypothetical protein